MTVSSLNDLSCLLLKTYDRYKQEGTVYISSVALPNSYPKLELLALDCKISTVANRIFGKEMLTISGYTSFGAFETELFPEKSGSDQVVISINDKEYRCSRFWIFSSCLNDFNMYLGPKHS